MGVRLEISCDNVDCCSQQTLETVEDFENKGWVDMYGVLFGESQLGGAKQWWVCPLCFPIVVDNVERFIKVNRCNAKSVLGN